MEQPLNMRCSKYDNHINSHIRKYHGFGGSVYTIPQLLLLVLSFTITLQGMNFPFFINTQMW